MKKQNFSSNIRGKGIGGYKMEWYKMHSHVLLHSIILQTFRQIK